MWSHSLLISHRWQHQLLGCSFSVLFFSSWGFCKWLGLFSCGSVSRNALLWLVARRDTTLTCSIADILKSLIRPSAIFVHSSRYCFSVTYQQLLCDAMPSHAPLIRHLPTAFRRAMLSRTYRQKLTGCFCLILSYISPASVMTCTLVLLFASLGLYDKYAYLFSLRQRWTIQARTIMARQ